MTFHSDETEGSIHIIIDASYSDIAARDADTDFHSNPANIDKIVRVDSPISYFILSDNIPSWIGNSGGDVSGPGSSTDNAAVRWDGILGDSLQNSGIIVDDSDNVFGVTSLEVGDGTNANPSTQANDLVISSTLVDVGMTLFSDDSRVTSIVFGSPSGTGNEGARIRWGNALNVFEIATTEANAEIRFSPGFLNRGMTLVVTEGVSHVAIGINTPNIAAKLDIASATQGLLPPRWTDANEASNITEYGPDQKGLIWFNTIGEVFKGWNGKEVEVFANDTPIFATLSSLVDQLPSVTTPVVITFDNQGPINGVTHSPIVNPGEITIDVSGVYTITHQPRIGKDSGATGTTFTAFMQIDEGSGFANIDNTAVFEVVKEADDVDITSFTFNGPFNAGDKIRFMQAVSNSSVGLGLIFIPASGAVPASPSAVISVHRIGGLP